MFENIKLWASKLKLQLKAIFIAAKDSRTPRAAKILAVAVTAYALSPIDLIPDFIPVLGYLDDLIIISLGISLIVKMIPSDLMATFRHEAKNLAAPKANWKAGFIIVFIWIAIAAFTLHFVMSS